MNKQYLTYCSVWERLAVAVAVVMDLEYDVYKLIEVIVSDS